jgi:predicted transcriptional regulator
MVSAAWVKAQATKAARAQALADSKAAAARAAWAGKSVAELVAEQLAMIAADKTGLAPHKATDPAVIAEVTAWVESRMAVSA